MTLPFYPTPFFSGAPPCPPNALKVAILGSRKFSNIKIATAVVKRLLERDPDVVIVSGGASGADLLAETLAKRFCRQPPIIITPKWKRADGSVDRSAGFTRNTLIVAMAHEVVALWDGASNGTLDSIRKSLAANKPTYVYSTAFKRWLSPLEAQGLRHPQPPAYRRPKSAAAYR